MVKIGVPLQLGGPLWTVQLGRRDATTASLDAANTEIPSPKSDLDDLISAYSKKGLGTTDMVALSGDRSEDLKLSNHQQTVCCVPHDLMTSTCHRSTHDRAGEVHLVP